MTKKNFLAILTLFLAVAAGHAGEESAGKELKRGPFTFTLPQGWYLPFSEQPVHKRGGVHVVATKDGIPFNRIDFKSHPLANPFDHTKKKIVRGMRPLETASIVLDDLQLDRSRNNFSLVQNMPVIICGRPGFRIVFSYTDSETLPYKAVYYGFQDEKFLYTIRYDAPAIDYFDTYLAAFERIAGSVTVNEPD